MLNRCVRLALLCPLPLILILALTLAVGCGDTDKPADPPAPGKGISQNDPPAEPSDDKAPATTDAPAPAQPTGQPGNAADAGITQPAAYYVDPHAGRSPFPIPGETIDTLIPARRITDAEQFANPIDPADIPAVVPWDQASRYVGHEITVEGTIVRVGKSNEVNFLNFAQDYRGKFYMVIFDDLATTLEGGATGTFEGKTVRVRGTVEPHRGTPQIKITSMDQVQFVD